MIAHSMKTLALLVLFVVGSFIELKAQDGAPEALVRTVSEQVFKAAAGSSPDADFKKILNTHLDIPAVAAFSLGKHAKRLPAAQNGEYRKLMKDNIVALFAKRAKSFRGQEVTIERVTARGANEFVVKTKVRFAEGGTKPVSWRVVKRGGAHKIFDVNVDGIWLALLQRDAFVGAIDKANGDVNALLASLRK